MQTTQITLDDLRTGDMIFAENDDAAHGAIHGQVNWIGQLQGTEVVSVIRCTTDGTRISENLRTGLFGTITRIDG